jgi:hypothetical protein
MKTSLHPLYGAECPLQDRPGTFSDRTRHTSTNTLKKMLGSHNLEATKYHTMEFLISTLTKYAFTTRLPTTGEEFTAIGVRVPTREANGFDRVAVVAADHLVPLVRIGMPLRWYLNKRDRPMLRLSWTSSEGVQKYVECSAARLLFNGRSDKFVRSLWSELYLHKSMFCVSQRISQGPTVKNVKHDPMVALRQHHMWRQSRYGHGYLAQVDVSRYLVKPEHISMSHLYTLSKR